MKIPDSVPSTHRLSKPNALETSRSGEPVAGPQPTSRVVFSSQRQVDSVPSTLLEMRTSPTRAAFRSERSDSAQQLRQSMERQFGSDLVSRIFNDKPLNASSFSLSDRVPNPFDR